MKGQILYMYVDHLFIGFAVGDAVGVPFIGKGRYEMEEKPATGLMGIKHTAMEKHAFGEFARQLMKGKTVMQAYDFIVKSLRSYYAGVVRMEDLLPYDKRITSAYPYFQEIFDGSLENIKKEDLVSSADVVCSIKTALWCLMNTSSYSERY